MKICKGRAFQNEGQEACFETDKFPYQTFRFLNSDGICSPGMEAEIWAEADPNTGTAIFYAEIDEN